MRTVGDDLRYAFRSYRRTPSQSIVAVVVIAVAVAFAAAFFRLYDDLALAAPGGFDRPAALIGIALSDAGAIDLRLPGRLRTAVAERSRTIETVASVVYVDDELEIDGSAVTMRAGVVSEGFFDGLGVRMHIGAGLDAPAGGTAGRPAVLDHGFWQRRFGADPAVLGREVRLGPAAFTIVGVAHPDFRGTHRGPGADVWFGLRGFAEAVWNARPDVIAERFRMVTVGRLAPGSRVDAAARELESLTDDLGPEFRDDLLGLKLTALENLAPDPVRHADAVRQVQLLVAAATLLALVAASNLSLLFLARAPDRRREMGIRLSVGATPCRLVRQLLVESSALVLAGAALGLLVTEWLAGVLRGLPSLGGLEWRYPDGLAWPAIAFIVLLTLAVTVAAAAAPAWNLARHSISARLSRRRLGLTGSQRLIVAAQVGIAAAVLSVALVFVEHLVRASSADPGYDATSVRVVELDRADDSLPRDSAGVTRFRQAISARLRAVGGVEGVAFGGAVPGLLTPDTYVVEAGPRDDEIASRVARVAPSWLEVLNLRVLRGRIPAPEDFEAVVVSRSFAQSAWGAVDVVGERVRAPAQFSPAGGAADGLSRLTVAAVVEDVQLATPGDLIVPVVLINRPMPGDIDDFLLLEGRFDMRDVQAVLEEALAAATPRLEVTRSVELESVLDAQLGPERARAVLTGVAGGFTALLSVLGFFGALRLMAGNARFEWALRSAVGAGPATLRNLFLRRGLVLALPGIVVGLACSAVLLDFVRAWFELRQAGAWPVLSVTALALGVLMCVLTWVPAARAAQAEPAGILRSE